MNESYAKLFSSITTSTVWSEPATTRVVWVTMMAIADRCGEVHASVPGLARVSNVTLPECEAALATFLAPDPYSRTPDNEGRRIEAIRGGWRLLNHGYYRKKLDAEDRKERQARWIADKRAKGKGSATVDAVDGVSTSPSTAVDNDQQGSTSRTSRHITDADAPTDVSSAKARAARGEISLAAAACIAMKAAGCFRVNPSDPNLLAALAEGVEPATLADCASEAVEAGKRNPFSYAIQVARGRHNDGAAPVGGRNANSPSGSSGGRRLSVVEQVQRNIDERREREAGSGATVDGTCERAAAG